PLPATSATPFPYTTLFRSLVSILRPSLLATMWSALAMLLELVFTPIGWLLAWLAALFPRGVVQPQQPPPRQSLPPMPNPAVLDQDRKSTRLNSSHQIISYA